MLMVNHSLLKVMGYFSLLWHPPRMCISPLHDEEVSIRHESDSELGHFNDAAEDKHDK